jgi:hypothetical protein
VIDTKVENGYGSSRRAAVSDVLTLLDPVALLHNDAVVNQVRVESSRAVFVLDEHVIVVGAVSVVVRIVINDSPYGPGARGHDWIAEGDRKVVGEPVVCAMVLRAAVSLQERVRGSHGIGKDV